MIMGTGKSETTLTLCHLTGSAYPLYFLLSGKTWAFDTKPFMMSEHPGRWNPIDNLCGSSAAMPVDHSHSTGNAYFILLQVDKYLIYIHRKSNYS